MHMIKGLKVIRMIYELGKLGNVENELIEEFQPDDANERGIDPGHHILQVLARSMKLEPDEGGEDDPCQWRTSA